MANEIKRVVEPIPKARAKVSDDYKKEMEKRIKDLIELGRG